MKEDVLEQIVDDYLQTRGYFTTHNLRFNPRKSHPQYVSQKDSVSSDVDVVGLHPMKSGPDRVMVVSCKSWQTGFDATRILAQLRGEVPNPKRPQELRFRELWIEKWAEGFVERIYTVTGQRQFTYCIGVTFLTGNTQAWLYDPTISRNLQGNPLRFLTLEEMWSAVLKEITTTPASSQIGRLAQLLKAAGLTKPERVAPPSPPPPGSAAAADDLLDQER